MIPSTPDPTGSTAWSLANLPATAAEIVTNLRAHGFDAEHGQQRQVLCLAEEVGEFVGAYRRWAGQARRSGTADEMHAELADVVITAFVTAEEFGVDLEALIGQKLAVVFSRGWREERAEPQPGSTAAAYLALVASYGRCSCRDVMCYGDVDDLPAGDGCLLCHHLDPEWACPADEDADYPEERAS